MNAHASRTTSSFPADPGRANGLPRPLRDYALIADGERGAVIGTDGDLAWMCFPGWADPALLAGLLGSGGRYQVVPEGRWVPGGYYERGTLIWRSRWVTDTGIVECREALSYPGETGRAVVLRRVVAVDGPARVRVVLDLRTDYGRRPLGTWHREGARWAASDGTVAARWSGGDEATVRRAAGGVDGLVLHLELAEGEQHDLVLELGAGTLADTPPARPEECWRRTEEAWGSAVPSCTDSAAPRDVQHSFAVLRGLTASSGGTAAAATMSLPERAEAGRNYDYRYSWVRDTCYVGRAGAVVKGGEVVLDDAVRWMVARLLADGPGTAPAYLVGGQPVPGEDRLELPGYPGGFDVVGNRAGSQFQLDVFGDALILLADAAALDRLDTDGWRAAETAIDAISRRWTEPDAGIWETEPKHWTQSRLVCVAGLRAICAAGAPANWTARVLPLADQILTETDRTSLHPSGRWQRAPDDERVDGSLLLAELRGALPSDDRRSRATRQAIAEELCEDGYLYRYAHAGRSLPAAEGVFLICSFWMALACLRCEDRVSGARWFERARASCGPAGLFSEEYDVEQRQMRGNLPQAFVHALLVECAAADEWA